MKLHDDKLSSIIVQRARALRLKAYKYRIYPTDEQVVFFAKTFGCCRFVWNKILEEKLIAYKRTQKRRTDTT